MNLEDAFRVQQLIARFANSFDRKDWGSVASCLASAVYTDSSELRGTPPETMSRQRFVESREVALRALKIHTTSPGMQRSTSTGRRASRRFSMLIQRRSSDGERFDTHCLYEFGVEKAMEHWTICSIVQRVLWSDGSEALHPGIARVTVGG